MHAEIGSTPAMTARRFPRLGEFELLASVHLNHAKVATNAFASSGSSTPYAVFNLPPMLGVPLISTAQKSSAPKRMREDGEIDDLPSWRSGY